MRLIVVNMVSAQSVESPSDAEVIGFQELKRLAVTAQLIRRFRAYDSVEMVVPSLETLGRILPTALLMRFLSRKSASIRGQRGGFVSITNRYIMRLTLSFARDFCTQRQLRRRRLSAVHRLSNRSRTPLRIQASPLYLRTDAVWGVQSGGSVGHIAGVINNLGAFGGMPIFVSTDTIPMVDPVIETHIVLPGPRYRDFPEAWLVGSDERLVQLIPGFLANRTISFVYQRSSLSNATGLEIATKCGVPLVLEFNGSEVWVARHWGRRLKHERFATEMELVGLSGADLVVVVSKPLRDELVGRGIDETKILVNPNGVDPEVYSPAVDGSAVRARLGLEGKLVIGFIGTFGRWHGAEVLADAFGTLLAEHPELRDRVRLLMIGDGVTMPEVHAAIERHGIAEEVVLTGLVPQEQGPAHLAACDILASPHVPNPDGTPFFGSPTKLFEYMAMGKGIVASDLDQIGEVLEHDRTAWMVEPGNQRDLADGLLALIDDRERRDRLGAAARAEAIARYTWLEHTRRIIEALKERCS